MNPSPQSREVPVTTTRSHGGMTKRKGVLATVVGTLAFEGEPEAWTHKPATDGRPEVYRSKVAGVEIWLKGVTPPEAGAPIIGVIEVKLNNVTKDGDSLYLYVNVLPLPDGATATNTVSIVRPTKEGNGSERRRVLPPGFNPATDYSVDRQGQPWQVITVRPIAS